MEKVRPIDGYNDTYACTYKQPPDGRHAVSYQDDFLGIFGIADWDGEHIATVVDRIVERFGDDDWFRSVIELSPFHVEGDMGASLSGMFNYDQLDGLHVLLCSAIHGVPMGSEDVKRSIAGLRL